MTYDNELTLIGQATVADDEIGNQIPAETQTVILCGLKSVSRLEFYNAALNDLRPERVFVVHAYEYNGEKTVEFEGERYRVIRTYGQGIEEVELTCEKVAADG
ncbi:MAG: phage head closure protein [Bacillota bacterium]